ncbi:hypothetical protein BJ742DRAFT_673021 [Cladochytrium replicatum]|nr:hypothetical protein BJ742DRAFT_673021 [Cladochytrium replicatum]
MPPKKQQNKATTAPAAVADPDNPESAENLISTFQTLAAEGDLLAQRNNFHEAIEVYTKALAIRPADKHCLVSRSRCYIYTGSPSFALMDADASLAEDKDFFKGIYQKAEALYAQGDFELALMFYHRGNRLRPELDEFRIGIQKSREAIENSIGNPKDHKISVPPRLRKNLAMAMVTSDSVQTGATGGGHLASSDLVTANLMQAVYSTQLTPTMESKLLAELYDDKVYLQQLLSDRDFSSHPNPDVLHLVTEGLRYLNTRVEFWRQQNPLYARPKEKKIRPRMERAVYAQSTSGSGGGKADEGKRARSESVAGGGGLSVPPLPQAGGTAAHSNSNAQGVSKIPSIPPVTATRTLSKFFNFNFSRNLNSILIQKRR